MKTGIYVRLSEVRPDEEAVSLDTQEADCRAIVERKGWEVAEVYRDPNRSAWKDDRNRPRWNEMLQDLEAGKLGAVVAWKQDRLGRNLAEIASAIDLCRRLGAVILTVVDAVDTSTAAGRGMAGNAKDRR